MNSENLVQNIDFLHVDVVVGWGCFKETVIKTPNAATQHVSISTNTIKCWFHAIKGVNKNGCWINNQEHMKHANDVIMIHPSPFHICVFQNNIQQLLQPIPTSKQKTSPSKTIPSSSSTNQPHLLTGRPKDFLCFGICQGFRLQ